MKIFLGSRELKHEALHFSGGEVQVRIVDGRQQRIGDIIEIEAELINSDAIMELLMVVDAIRRRAYEVSIRLRAPYFPYARQDRVCAPGEAISLKVMCDLINAQNFQRVEIWDAHSDVTPALLNNVRNIHCSAFVKKIDLQNTVFVAPDAGALKKVSVCAYECGRAVVEARKTRNQDDGSITKTEVYSDHIGKQDFLIIDDICDGGRTFIELAKKLRPLTDGKIKLYVTHGIFSKGLSVFDGLIDTIYCPNVFPNVFPLSKLWHL